MPKEEHISAYAIPSGLVLREDLSTWERMYHAENCHQPHYCLIPRSLGLDQFCPGSTKSDAGILLASQTAICGQVLHYLYLHLLWHKCHSSPSERTQPQHWETGAGSPAAHVGDRGRPVGRESCPAISFHVSPAKIRGPQSMLLWKQRQDQAKAKLSFVRGIWTGPGGKASAALKGWKRQVRQHSARDVNEVARLIIDEENCGIRWGSLRKSCLS